MYGAPGQPDFTLEEDRGAPERKPRQSLLYEFGELSGPYPLYSSLLSNHAAQQQKETLMLKKRGMDM